VFQGLRTNIFRVKPKDLESAKIWYSKLLGKAPYFDEPFYVGFNVAGFELGLDPSEEKIALGNNVHVYWGVSNIEQAFAHCLKLQAEPDSEIKNVGGDIKVATIRDPFGNILGLIENPGFKLE
jgi:predicted enzyme related to lactoylglutathione lyase